MKSWYWAILLLALGCSQKETQLPNILVLLADDAGWQDFGCYGNPYIETPNIDRLAENGWKSTNAFLTIAQCSPSRISMLTGRYPHSTGAEDLHMPMPDTLNTLPVYLSQKNYFSGLLKKGHLGEAGHNQFDWYRKDLDLFDSFLDLSEGRPFFMWVGFTDPHRPYFDNIIHNPQAPSNVIVPPYLMDDDHTRNDLARYYNYIRRMDERIGYFLKVLADRKLLESTVIIFLSDNGAPFPRAKGTVYDAGIKTPLIVHWPGYVPAGSSSNALLSMVDLAPSILSLTGLKQPAQFQGVPIAGLFDDKEVSGRDAVFSERNWHNCDEHIRSIRTSRFKLILNAYLDVPLGPPSDIGRSPSFKSLLRAKEESILNQGQELFFQVPRSKIEFYDLENDPEELHNLHLSLEYQPIIKELQTELDNWISETRDFPPDQRKRKDNTDRFTGIKFDKTRLPDPVL